MLQHSSETFAEGSNIIIHNFVYEDVNDWNVLIFSTFDLMTITCELSARVDEKS